MSQIHVLKAEIAKLPREEVDQLVVGLMAIISSIPLGVETVEVLAVASPEIFKRDTHTAVMCAIGFMAETGEKIRRIRQERN